MFDRVKHFFVSKKYKKTRIRLLICFLLCVVLVTTVYIIEKKTNPDQYVVSHEVIINGKNYREKNLKNILFIGLDTFGDAGGVEGNFNNDDLADFLALVSLDTVSKKYNILHINRDSIVQIDEIGVNGKLTGSKITGQIALSHAYGDGGKQSCENTVRAVSRLLHDIKIDNYISITMDAIKVVNDYSGGVPVTFDNDYTDIAPEYTKGATVTLTGDQALTFVRERYSTAEKTNISRMERQKCYIKSFFKMLADKNKDNDFVIGAYEQVSDGGYLCTDCTIKSLLNTFGDISEYSFGDIRSPEGQTDIKDDHVVFYIDEFKLDDLIAELFYDEKK